MLVVCSVPMFWGTLSSTPRPPVSFYIGLFMQLVIELTHLAHQPGTVVIQGNRLYR